MALFDKKYCDICGEKIKLLGNRKLEDGNLCSKCAKKLSPYFNERRKSTVADIQNQINYRADNEQQLLNFVPSRIFGHNTQIMIDENSRKFIVTNRRKWQEHNPDLISLDQVTYCNVRVDEDRSEIYREDNTGKRVSYEPSRYKYEYSFYIELGIQSPWFDLIKFELTQSMDRPDSRHDRRYRDYERQGEEIRQYMSNRGAVVGQPNPYGQQGYNQSYQEPMNQPYQQQMNQPYVQQPVGQQFQQPINQPYQQPGMGIPVGGGIPHGGQQHQQQGQPFGAVASGQTADGGVTMGTPAGVVMGTPVGTPVGTPAGNPVKAPIDRPKFCPNCGSDLSTQAPSKFCPNCGSAL